MVMIRFELITVGKYFTLIIATRDGKLIHHMLVNPWMNKKIIDKTKLSQDAWWKFSAQ